MDPVALLVLLGVWLVDVAALAPLLLFDSTRRLFDGWPTGHVAANYALAATGYTVVHILVAFAPGIATGSVGPGWLAASTFGLLAVSWIALAVVAPRLGWWAPTAGDGWDGRLALGSVVLGYVGAVAALALFALIGLFVVFSRFPG